MCLSLPIFSDYKRPCHQHMRQKTPSSSYFGIVKSLIEEWFSFLWVVSCIISFIAWTTLVQNCTYFWARPPNMVIICLLRITLPPFSTASPKYFLHPCRSEIPTMAYIKSVFLYCCIMWKGEIETHHLSVERHAHLLFPS